MTMAWWSFSARASIARGGRGQPIALGAAAVLCSALGATILLPPVPRFVWNASASAPIGLYHVHSERNATIGDLVVARPPVNIRQLAASRHYVPNGVPLIKRVAAGTGDRICATGRVITINGRDVAHRQRSDRHRRPMPWWHGCTTLEADRVFLLMVDAPGSFDGRYFGPSPRRDLIGTATALSRAR